MFALIHLTFEIAVIIAVGVGLMFLYFWRRALNRPMTLQDFADIRGFPLTREEEDEVANVRSEAEARAVVKRLVAKKPACH